MTMWSRKSCDFLNCLYVLDWLQLQPVKRKLSGHASICFESRVVRFSHSIPWKDNPHSTFMILVGHAIPWLAGLQPDYPWLAGSWKKVAVSRLVWISDECVKQKKLVFKEPNMYSRLWSWLNGSSPAYSSSPFTFFIHRELWTSIKKDKSHNVLHF